MADVHMLVARLNAWLAEPNPDFESEGPVLEAIDALRRELVVPDPEAVDALGRCLEHPSLRHAAAWALGTLKRDALPALQPLIDALLDLDPLTREKVAWALGEVGSLDATEALMEVSATDPVQDVRTAAGKAVDLIWKDEPPSDAEFDAMCN